ncbi:MAG TPA: RidA family protein [Thermoanaerobaculia bacterium]|nr:RidA family protein [Thermoanaerobaculia bacterium]
MANIMERLIALNIALPDAAPAIVSGYTPVFAPYVITGNLVSISGRLAKKDGAVWRGKLGAEVTVREGQEAARGVAIELLATLRDAAGDLNRVQQIVRLMVLVNGTLDFTEPHAVANGASELFVQLFDERGRHARTAMTAAQLPFGACVEIEMLAELEER